MVQFVEDIELIAYHSCQPMGRGLCSKSRAAGAPRASRGLVLPREAWTRKTSPFFATCIIARPCAHPPRMRHGALRVRPAVC